MKNTNTREINIDKLDSVSGGYLFEASYCGMPTAIEVIDDNTGDVAAR